LELNRVSKNRIIWGCNYFTQYIKDVGRIIHDKTGGGNKTQLHELSDVDLASHSFGVNMKIFSYVWQGNAQGNKINWNQSGQDGRIHPCQKPVALYEWLLQRYAKQGDLILDTHLGSGSTAIATNKYGFDLIACESDLEHYQNACQRIRTWNDHPDMFTPPVTEPKQEILL